MAWTNSRPFRYLLVGVYNTAFGFGLFALLFVLLGTRWHYLIIAAVAHFVAVTQSFVTQKVLVFRSHGHWGHEYLKFQVAYLGGLAVTFVALPFCIAVLGWHPLVAQAFVTAAVVLSTYVFHRHLTFKIKRVGK